MRGFVLFLVAALTALPASAAFAGGRPRIALSAATVIDGDPVSVRLAGLPPRGLATIHIQSIMHDDDGAAQPFYGRVTVRADARGRVDLARATPVSGYYRGADRRGLFWSQRALAGDPEARRTIAALHLASPASIGPGRILLSLEVSGAISDRRALSLLAAPPGIIREAVRAEGLVGVLYHARGARRRPVVVVLGGSEGGLDVADWIGPKLAARGFTVFGLDYFSPPASAVAGVPTILASIPVESLERVRDWLAARPEADTGRLGLVGYSKGAEFALVLASTYGWVRAVVAYAPSDHVWQGIRYDGGPPLSSWSRGGRDLPFLSTAGVRDEIVKSRQPGGRACLACIARTNLQAASPAQRAAAAIPVERSRAALLLVGGGDDQLWDSGPSVARLAARLAGASYPHPHVELVYPGAGHVLIGTGWRPTTGDDDDPIRNGGTAEADAQAQAQSWQRMLAFLGHEL